MLRDHGNRRLGLGAGVNHGGVADPELVRRARNAGVSTEYYDWRGQHVEVPEETLAAIVQVIEQAPEHDDDDAIGAADADDAAGVVDAGRSPQRLSVPAE